MVRERGSVAPHFSHPSPPRQKNEGFRPLLGQKPTLSIKLHRKIFKFVLESVCGEGGILPPSPQTTYQIAYAWPRLQAHSTITVLKYNIRICFKNLSSLPPPPPTHSIKDVLKQNIGNIWFVHFFFPHNPQKWIPHKKKVWYPAHEKLKAKHKSHT